MCTYLRPTEKSDYPLIMSWRSNPLVFQGFYRQTEPLKWEEHIAWIKSRNQDWRNFIIMYEDRPVGGVTIGQLDHWEPEVGYYIGEVSLWGKGIGREAVKLALDYIKNHGREHCHTTVLESNERSIRLLESLGFKKNGEARKGEIWMKAEL